MVEFVATLLVDLGKDLAQSRVSNLFQWVMGYFRRTLPKPRADEVQSLLQRLGHRTDQDHREMVQSWAIALKPPMPKKQQEELINLLINLSHKARFHSTHGTPRSSYLRSERWLEQLLSDIRPMRQWGEPVGEGWREWKLEKFLGMGTFGEVWLAKNPGYPELWAFKFFTREGSKDWIEKERAALYSIRKQLGTHPNIIEFKNVVVDDQKWPFLVLEYVGGGSLEDWILSDPEERLPLKPDEVVEDIVRGLSQAHAKGVYHRDLKPANLLLTDDRDDVRAKIADFGLGKVDPRPGILVSAQVSQALTVGTSMYLPPEAMETFRERQPAKDDVFALGVIWYQLLVEELERPPYDFVERLKEKAVDSHTIQLICRCLARADRRFGDACELEQAMRHLPPIWPVPNDCFDVQYLVREYMANQTH